MTTLYAAEARQRVDFGNGTAVITQCDSRQALQVNDTARAYTALAFAPAQPSGAEPPGGKPRGVVHVKVVATDTGETRELFGQQARRVRIVTTTEPGPNACDKKKGRLETDGWYAALHDMQLCAAAATADLRSEDDCADERETEVVGNASPGYPLAYTMLAYDSDGKEVSRVTSEVTALTREPRDPALFEAPVAFTKVADANALSAAARRAELEALGTTPKAAGVIRVGVASPTDRTDRGMAPAAVADDLLEVFADKPFEAVPISATEPEAQIREAATKECDYLLRTELAQLTTSKPGRMGGLVRRASGGGNPAELHEAKVNVEIAPVSGKAPPRKHAASAKTGSFTWRRAAGLARFAGRIYFGMTAGLMNNVMSMARGGTLAGNDPTMGALNMLLGSGAEPEDAHSPEYAIAAAFNRGASEIKADLRKSLGSK